MAQDATTITVKLDYPVSLYDEFERREYNVTELELPKRLKAKHLRALDSAQGEISQTLALLVSITGYPKSVIDELDAEDLEKLGDALEVPLANGQETGPT
ncbi:phage tail assembly protein [Alloalcanivorax xenomutans]|uniref:Phage tail assembly protein n=1 Tax=Alloalcanivorax xenomutans TaxID=1094342 RepID=A0A9Q3ZI28_9GAMM|nr:phage tail assembly protein [Alloalcanivorax xenomutans]MCE7510257.1 phage tail assembly protein [Alloalcanivorax xenomutans]